MKKFEVKEVCQECDGTGLYQGMAEHDGFAVVCNNCGGTGCHHLIHIYEEFEKKRIKEGVKQVIQNNCGICVGIEKTKETGQLTYDSFGGVCYSEWQNLSDPNKFPKKTEMRNFTCPYWWNYQSKPKWKKCIKGSGYYSNCEHFSNKSECWKEFDKENE